MKGIKHHSPGFIFSLLLHSAIVAGVCYALKTDDAANSYQASLVDTSISMEMMMATVVENSPEPEPEKQVQPEPEKLETVPDPTIQPKPVKEPPKEKPKEKPKTKPKEKPKDKPQENAKVKATQPNLPKADKAVEGNANTTSVATTLTNKVNTNNPNLIGKGASSSEIDAYKSALRREIERNKAYPNRERMMHKQGIVTVGINIGNDGSLNNVSVVKSSGFEGLDKAAIQAVNRTRAIGPKPVGMQPYITIPLNFTLN